MNQVKPILLLTAVLFTSINMVMGTPYTYDNRQQGSYPNNYGNFNQGQGYPGQPQGGQFQGGYQGPNNPAGAYGSQNNQASGAHYNGQPNQPGFQAGVPNQPGFQPGVPQNQFNQHQGGYKTHGY